MRAEVVERVALARQAAQQQKAAAEAQFVAEAGGRTPPSVGSGKLSGVMSGKSSVAERAQMRERRVDLGDLGAGEHVHALLAVIDPGALPGGRTFDRRQRVNHRPASFDKAASRHLR